MRRARVFLIAAAVAACMAAGPTARDFAKERAEAYAHLDEVLTKHDRVEGHTHNYPKRESCLRSLAARPDVTRMAEIGFNAGHSTVTLLGGSPGKTLTSFDLCTHSYYEETSAYLLKRYEGQLEIICGDSTKTLPELIEKGVPKFDLIHIDGGHQGDVPRQDLLNSLQLSHPDTFILLDDCNEVKHSPEHGYVAQSVISAWRFGVKNELIEPVSFGSCNIGNCLSKPVVKGEAPGTPPPDVAPDPGKGSPP